MQFRHSIAAAFVAVSVALSAGAALAHEVTLGALRITDLWTRATPPGAAAGGGFMTIANTGKEADRLVKVASPTSDVMQIHEMAVVDGVMKMREIPGGIVVPAGGTVKLAPGGLHIMFMAIRQPFAAGTDVPVTLTFEKAGSVETMLHVMPIGSMGPGPHGAAPAAGAMPMDHGPMTHGAMPVPSGTTK